MNATHSALDSQITAASQQNSTFTVYYICTAAESELNADSAASGHGVALD